MTTIFQRSDIFKLDIMDIDLFEQPLYSIPALVWFDDMIDWIESESASCFVLPSGW